MVSQETPTEEGQESQGTLSGFYRFPPTPHLDWLADGATPRDDKLLSQAETRALLSTDVVVEEKLDGANLGISLAPSGELRLQNRGQYLMPPYSGQFAHLNAWLAQHEPGLRAVLTPELILFGEWCAARHSLSYHGLPDWFLLFDVFDGTRRAFWSTGRRNALASRAGLFTVPVIRKGRVTLAELKRMVTDSISSYRDGQPLEGLVVRQENSDWCMARAKLVRPDFTQSMEHHWRRRAIEWNRVLPR